MSEQELDTVMRNTTEISDADIRRNGLVFAMIDELGANRDFLRGRAAVVNTAASSDPQGIHWLAMRRFANGEVLVFDPLGPDNETRPHDDLMNAQLEALGRIRWFPFAVQSRTTHHCGWFSIVAAKLMDAARDPSGAISALRARFARVPIGKPNGKEARMNVKFLIHVAGYNPSTKGDR